MKKNPKAPRARTPATTPVPHQDRLLRQLGGQNAYGTAGDLTPPGRIDLYATRNGVTLKAGSAARADAQELVSAGLAEWIRGKASGRERLEITQAGRARLLRLDAGEADPFFAQHRPTGVRDIEVAGSTRKAVVDFAESPLARLAVRRNAQGEAMLDPALFEAGERLRRDLTFAQMVPRVTANWDPGAAGTDRNGAPMTYSDIVVASRQRVDLAMRAVGPEFAGLLMDVCGFLKGFEQIEAERQWPRRSAKLVLEFALVALARHYGLEREARGPERSKGLRHWGAADFRPRA